MNQAGRVRHSVYLEWAKTSLVGRYNLAMSGVAEYPVSDLPVSPEDLGASSLSFYGYRPLVERLARRCGADPDGLVTALGCSMANFLVMAALLEPGDEVLIEQPAYEPLVATATFLGARVRRFLRPADEGFRVDPVRVERELTRRTRLIVVTNLHNPTSSAAEEPTLRLIGEMARSIGARVLVDEVYRETLDDGRIPSAWRLDRTFVVTSSLTKAFGLASLRCGWIVADPDLARRLWRLHDLVEVVPPPAVERLSCVALDHLPQIAARARAILEQNRRAVRRFLAERPDLEATVADGGTVVFPRLRSGQVEELCRRLKERYETLVVPGRFFDAPEHFRLGLGAPPEIVQEGLARLGRALDELAEGGRATAGPRG